MYLSSNRKSSLTNTLFVRIRDNDIVAIFATIRAFFLIYQMEYVVKIVFHRSNATWVLAMDNIEDAEKADAIFTKLMGDQADLRKNFIQSRAATVDLDDLDF